MYLRKVRLWIAFKRNIGRVRYRKRYYLIVERIDSGTGIQNEIKTGWCITGVYTDGYQSGV